MEQLVEGVRCSACSMLPSAQISLLSSGTSAFSTPNTAIVILAAWMAMLKMKLLEKHAMCADMNKRSQGTMKILLVVNMVSVCLKTYDSLWLASSPCSLKSWRLVLRHVLLTS